MQKAQKKKLPFIKDGANIICDSFFILDYLTKKYNIDIDKHLTAEQQAQAYFISRSIEESLYWCIVYFRWGHEKSWQVIKQEFFSKMPFPLKVIVPFFARKSVLNLLHGHGMGRHSEAEILTIAQHHLESINTTIKDKHYLFGEKPCSADATIYAFLAEIYLARLDTPLSEMAKQYPNLEKYCLRFYKQFYS